MNKYEIGQAIANERIRQGITIRKMAELANTSPRTIQAVEKGWYNVGIETYLALAQQLGVELHIKPIERSKGAE